MKTNSRPEVTLARCWNSSPAAAQGIALVCESSTTQYYQPRWPVTSTGPHGGGVAKPPTSFLGISDTTIGRLPFSLIIACPAMDLAANIIRVLSADSCRISVIGSE
jgi:hypothetical protein